MTRDKYGIPNYANSTLLSMPKSELLGYIRTIEHNWRGAEETIEIQANNCMKLLAEERNKAIDDFKIDILNKIQFEEKWLFDCKSDNADTRIAFSALKTFCENRAEQLKAGGNNGI